MATQRDAVGNDYLQLQNRLIAEQIRRARARLNMSAETLAQRMRDVGADNFRESTVFALESGKRNLRAGELADLARILEISPVEILSPPLSDRLRELIETVRFMEQRRKAVREALDDDEEDRTRALRLLHGLTVTERRHRLVPEIRRIVNQDLRRWIDEVIEYQRKAKE